MLSWRCVMADNDLTEDIIAAWPGVRVISHEVEPMKNGTREQFVVTFANGMGASIVRSPYHYGGDHDLWELLPLDEWGDGAYLFSDEHLGARGGVLGWLDITGVELACGVIAAYKRPRFRFSREWWAQLSEALREAKHNVCLALRSK